MRYRFILFILSLICLSNIPIKGKAQVETDTIYNPSILYSSTPKKYTIAGISVKGIENYEDYVLIGLSGLSVGQVISVPGDEITSAIKRLQ